MAILNTFDAAIRCGIPTAMLGQGFGPIQNPTLCKRAAEVLPRVNALFIREQRAGLPLLEKMDVSRTKIFVTGDDAIEPAFCEKRQTLGTRLGVNLRIAGYSALDEGFWKKSGTCFSGGHSNIKPVWWEFPYHSATLILMCEHWNVC